MLELFGGTYQTIISQTIIVNISPYKTLRTLWSKPLKLYIYYQVVWYYDQLLNTLEKIVDKWFGVWYTSIEPVEASISVAQVSGYYSLLVFSYPGLAALLQAQRARVLRRDNFTPSIIHNTKPLSFDIKPYSLYKFMCGLIQKPYSFSMFLYAQYGGLVVCRIPRKCGLI